MTLVRYCQLHPEAAFNTRDTTPVMTDLRVLEETLKLNQNYGIERDIEHRIFNTVRYGRGQIVEGDLKMTGRPNEVCELLKTHFSKLTTSALTDGYSHTFTYQDDPTKTIPTVGLDIGYETLKTKYFTGINADVVTLNIPKADEIEWTFGCIGELMTGQTFGSPSPTYSTLEPYYGADITTTQLDGSTVTWDNLQIVMNSGKMRDHHRVGSRTLPDMELGPVEVDITGDVKFTSSTLLENFLSESYHTFDLLTRSDLIGGSDYYDMTFNLDKLTSMEDPGPHINRQDRMIQNLNLKMIYSSSTTFSLVINDNSATPATYTGA